MGESLFSNDEFTAFDCGFSRKKLGRPEILYLFYLCIFFEKEASKMHSEKWDIITCPLGHIWPFLNVLLHFFHIND